MSAALLRQVAQLLQELCMILLVPPRLWLTLLSHSTTGCTSYYTVKYAELFSLLSSEAKRLTCMRCLAPTDRGILVQLWRARLAPRLTRSDNGTPKSTPTVCIIMLRSRSLSHPDIGANIQPGLGYCVSGRTSFALSRFLLADVTRR